MVQLQPHCVSAPPEAETPKVEATDGESFKRLKPGAEVENTQLGSTSSTSSDEAKATCSPAMALEVEDKTKNNGDPSKVDDKQEPPQMNDTGNPPKTADTNDQEQQQQDPNTPQDSKKPEENGTAQSQPDAVVEKQEPANEKPGPAVWKGARKVLTRQAGQNPVQVCVLLLFQFLRAHIYDVLSGFQHRISNPP